MDFEDTIKDFDDKVSLTFKLEKISMIEFSNFDQNLLIFCAFIGNCFWLHPNVKCKSNVCKLQIKFLDKKQKK